MKGGFNPYGALGAGRGEREGRTCDPCLGLGFHALPRHQLCLGNCACDVCPRPPAEPPAPRTPKKTKQVLDVPDEVKARAGRFMTAEQVEWCFRLREAGYELKEIGALLGGFGHPSVHATLTKGRMAT